MVAGECGITKSRNWQKFVLHAPLIDSFRERGDSSRVTAHNTI